MKWHIQKSSAAEVKFIDAKIVEFNNLHVPFTHNKSKSFNFHIKDDHNTIIAGITAKMYFGQILYIDVLFVEENYRKSGLGSALLRKVEDVARLHGAKLAHLYTFDFQAKDFYIKHGYEVFGQLNDCPAGHICYYLKRSFP